MPKKGVIFDASWLRRKKRIASTLVILVIFLSGLIFLPRLVSAHFPVLIHILRPQLTKSVYQCEEPVSISLHVQNVSPVSFTTPLCVREVVGGRSYHLGCVPEVTFAPFNGGSRFNFNVTRSTCLPGRHLVIFSYRDLGGRWHEILDSGLHLMRAIYWVN